VSDVRAIDINLRCRAMAGTYPDASRIVALVQSASVMSRQPAAFSVSRYIEPRRLCFGHSAPPIPCSRIGDCQFFIDASTENYFFLCATYQRAAGLITHVASGSPGAMCCSTGDAVLVAGSANG
jgi:hypothetical protein